MLIPRRILPGFGLLTILFSASVFGQEYWVPYSADYISVDKTLDYEGNVLSTIVVSGKEQRSSDGSVLLRMTDESHNTKARLRDAGTGKIWNLDYQSGVAKAQQLVDFRHHPLKGPTLGTQVIEGLPCDSFPIRDGQTKQQDGTVCMDQTNEIALKREIVKEFPARQVKRVWTVERRNVLIGVEPKASDLSIPATFKKVDMIGSMQCTACNLHK